MSSGIYVKNTGYHNRRSIRLKGYDYSHPGAYFITICVKNRECIFGEIVDGSMVLNNVGEIVEKCWNDLPDHYMNIILDSHVIMPNHFHGIIVIDDVPLVWAGLKPAHTRGLPEFVRALKTFSARRINKSRQTTGIPVWQRNYYEHIIRDEAELNGIRQYISDNPKNWESDDNFIERYGNGMTEEEIRIVEGGGRNNHRCTRINTDG